MLEYMLMMHMNINMIANTLLRNTTSIEESKEVALRLNQEIKNEKYSQYFKSFMLAKNIDYWMNQFGANYPIDSLYLNFKNQYPASQFLEMIENRYDKLSDLLPGRDAPLIEGTTLGGAKVSTDDFKGKIIYIDVWASWCGPCISEIPFAVELQNSFTPVDPIVFLNVSVDKDTADWRAALFDRVNWKGIHIASDPSIYSTYNIAGIPRYIIIDQKGKIVTTDAPRPSTKELKNQLKELTRKAETKASE
jgi:thiol-disulfide isomerase/thioredoxin